MLDISNWQFATRCACGAFFEALEDLQAELPMRLLESGLHSPWQRPALCCAGPFEVVPPPNHTRSIEEYLRDEMWWQQPTKDSRPAGPALAVLVYIGRVLERETATRDDVLWDVRWWDESQVDLAMDELVAAALLEELDGNLRLTYEGFRALKGAFAEG